MYNVRPLKYFLPAIFLFVLGLGNILVGHYKELQYRQVYEELTESEPLPQLPSAISRIQAVPQVQDRHLRRQMEARERRNLYRLVGFGGKTFMSLSVIFFFLALFARYAAHRDGNVSDRNVSRADTSSANLLRSLLPF